MVYANGISPFNFHKNKGYFQIFIHSNNKVDVTLDGELTNFHKIHGLIMYFTWGLMTFLLFVSGRYLKTLYLAWVIIHSVSGTLILIFTLIAISFAEWGSTIPVENRLYHYGSGELLEFVVISIVSVGYILRGLIYLCGCSEWVESSHWRFIWLIRHLHKLAGKIAILFSMWTMFAGLFSYEEEFNLYKILLIVHWVSYLVAILFIEVYHLIWWKNKDYYQYISHDKQMSVW